MQHLTCKFQYFRFAEEPEELKKSCKNCSASPTPRHSFCEVRSAPSAANLSWTTIQFFVPRFFSATVRCAFLKCTWTLQVLKWTSSERKQFQCINKEHTLTFQGTQGKYVRCVSLSVILNPSPSSWKFLLITNRNHSYNFRKCDWCINCCNLHWLQWQAAIANPTITKTPTFESPA